MSIFVASFGMESSHFIFPFHHYFFDSKMNAIQPRLIFLDHRLRFLAIQYYVFFYQMLLENICTISALLYAPEEILMAAEEKSYV
jgi:hypothetical protein